LVDPTRLARFNEIAVPHMDAAYRLARWLTRNEHDAQDVVQEAYLRAFRFFDGYRGGDARAWVLKIVRHTCLTWLGRNRPAELVAVSEEEIDDELALGDENCPVSFGERTTGKNPETLLLERRDDELLNRLIGKLPPLYREVVVLREIEDLSYREIADVLTLPIGTVMSRLARARQRLQHAWRGVSVART
jgi:RNA polymerase sigma-70 factor (ECF subfamily)